MNKGKTYLVNSELTNVGISPHPSADGHFRFQIPQNYPDKGFLLKRLTWQINIVETISRTMVPIRNNESVYLRASIISGALIGSPKLGLPVVPVISIPDNSGIRIVLFEPGQYDFDFPHFKNEMQMDVRYINNGLALIDIEFSCVVEIIEL